MPSHAPSVLERFKPLTTNVRCAMVPLPLTTFLLRVCRRQGLPRQFDHREMDRRLGVRLTRSGSMYLMHLNGGLLGLSVG